MQEENNIDNIINNLKSTLNDNDKIVNYDNSQILISIYRSISVSATLKLQIQDQYCNKEIFINLESKQLNDKLLTTMKDSVDKQYKNNEHKTIQYYYTKIRDIFDNNKLLACFEEIQDIKSRNNNILSQEDKIKIDQKNSNIIIKFKEQEYYIQVAFNIPLDQPQKEPVVIYQDYNMPQTLIKILTDNVKEISRRCFFGIDINEDLNKNIKLNKSNIGMDSTILIIQAGDQMNTEKIKRDINFLKINADLSKQKDNKDARRNKSRLINKEDKYEEKLYNTTLKNSMNNNYDLNNKSERSLKQIVRYISQEFIHRIPNEQCQQCKIKILDINIPNFIGKIKDNSNKFLPERIQCGHWFHQICLDKFFKNPPWDKLCPTCNKTVSHHAFKTNIKILQKQQAQDQIKEQEAKDAIDCFADLF